MSKTTKTFSEALQFQVHGESYIAKHKEAENKLCVSIRSVLKQVVKLIDDYQEKLTECQIDNCACDDRGVMLKDAKGHLQFTKEGQKAVNKKQKELLNAICEIHQRIRPENDALAIELSPDEIDSFADIVITKPKDEL